MSPVSPVGLFDRRRFVSRDRFIKYKPRQAPSREDIETVLLNFLGGVGSVEFQDGRFFVSLPGTPTPPYEGIEGAPKRYAHQKERWIEVIPGNPIDVLTRQQDAFTNALADQIAQLLTRYWNGDMR